MKEKTIVASDSVVLKCAVSEASPDYPWVALILPFGLELQHARAFFDFFGEYFNIFSWQARLILDDDGADLAEGALNAERHVQDLFDIMSELSLAQVIAVGYCSGAGISLLAANHKPECFSHLVLVNGEYTLLNKEDCMTQFGSDIDKILSVAAQNPDKAALVFEKIKGSIKFAGKDLPPGLEVPYSNSRFLYRHGVNYLAYKAFDFEALASNIKHNTYMLAGGRDEQSNINSSQTIKSLIEKAELHIDPDGDHYEILRPESKALVNIWNNLIAVEA
ncbi:MAG: alpha/beta hydrolase [Wenzhouxiangellaceae bacterium]